MTFPVLGGFLIGASLGLVALSAAMLVIAWMAHRDNGCLGQGCRQDAGRHGGPGKYSRPAEPDRETLLRVFRETGWIDVDTVRRLTR